MKTWTWPLESLKSESTRRERESTSFPGLFYIQYIMPSSHRAVLRHIGHNTFLPCFVPILQLLTLRSSRLIEVDPAFPVPCEYQRWKHQHAKRYVGFENSSIRFNLFIQCRTTFNFLTPPIHPRSFRISSPQRPLLSSGLEKEGARRLSGPIIFFDRGLDEGLDD
jgi:hypothetical protein